MNPVSDIPGLARLWQDTGGDPAIRIAVIDGPADFAHPSLSGAGLSFGGSTAGATAAGGSEHGTPVASILMGRPGGPIFGFAPNVTARIFSIGRDGDDDARTPSSQADLALAIDHTVAEGVHPINISSGRLTPTGQAERSLAERATPPCPRYHGTDKRFYLAPGVRVQRPRHAQRLAGSAPARPPILPGGLQGHQRHDQAPRLGKEGQ